MALSVGIVGLPNSGKSTLFNTLVGEHLAKVADYPFTTIEPNVGVIAVPDERLSRIAELIANSKSETLNPKQIQHSNVLKPKTIPATIQFVDVAGLVEGAHQGKGLGNQFLAHIRDTDALVLLTRGFDLISEPADPHGAAELVQLELELGGIRKPTLVIENTNGPVVKPNQVNAQTGDGVDTLITRAYELLGLITFYTIKEQPSQVQAWSIASGTTALDAAGKVHTDFARGFIKAAVVSFEDLMSSGGIEDAKAKGKLRFEGKNYQLADGDVVHFRAAHVQ